MSAERLASHVPTLSLSPSAGADTDSYWEKRPCTGRAYWPPHESESGAGGSRNVARAERGKAGDGSSGPTVACRSGNRCRMDGPSAGHAGSHKGRTGDRLVEWDINRADCLHWSVPYWMYCTLVMAYCSCGRDIKLHELFGDKRKNETKEIAEIGKKLLTIITAMTIIYNYFTP